MPQQSPVAPPRNRKKNKKYEISSPFNFCHVQHIGADFNSEDVKRALRTKGVLTEYAEQVQRNSSMPFSIESADQTYVLPSPSKSDRSNLSTPVHSENFLPMFSSSPPRIEAPTYIDPNEASHYDHILNWTAEEPAQNNIVNYENFPTSHTYVNTMNPKSTKTRKAPSPPSYENKPKLSVTTPDSQTSPVNDSLPIWRKEKAVPTATTPTLQMKISTPERVERRSISPAIQRPDRLLNQLQNHFEIGLDDIVPPPSRTPTHSKSSLSTPNSIAGTLTRRTMAPPPISKQLAEEAQRLFEGKRSLDEPSSASVTGTDDAKVATAASVSVSRENDKINDLKEKDAEESEKYTFSNAFISQAATPSTEPSTPVPKPRTRISLSQTNQKDVPEVIQSNIPEKKKETPNLVETNTQEADSSCDEDEYLVCRF